MDVKRVMRRLNLRNRWDEGYGYSINKQKGRGGQNDDAVIEVPNFSYMSYMKEDETVR